MSAIASFMRLIGRTYEESGKITTLGPDKQGNPQPVTVTLSGSYASLLNVNAWAETVEPTQVFISNVKLPSNNSVDASSFDVVALNLRGEPVALTVNWYWRGV